MFKQHPSSHHHMLQTMKMRLWPVAMPHLLADGAGESRGTSSSREAHQLAQQQSQHASSAYDEDEALAKAIAASLKEDQKPPKPQSKANTTGSANAKKEDSCVLS
eukprot:Em0022g261a